MSLAISYSTGKTRHGKGLEPNMPTRTNLTAWWRYRTGVINTSGGCTQWSDQSGNGNNLLQANASLAPTVTSDGGLQFDGVQDYMQATFTLAQPISCYIAFQQITSSNGNIIFDGKTGTCKMNQGTGNAVAINAGTGLGTDTTMTVGSMGVACAVFNSTTSVLQTAGGAASVTTTGDANTTGMGGFTLGASRTPGNYSKIYVREVALFSVAHDAPTRLWMLRYMARIANLGGV